MDAQDQDNRISFPPRINIWKEMKSLIDVNLYQDVSIHCSDGTIRTNAVLLSNLNQFWYNILISEASFEEFEILLPSETTESVDGFLTKTIEIFSNSEGQFNHINRSELSNTFEDIKVLIKEEEVKVEPNSTDHLNSMKYIDDNFINENYFDMSFKQDNGENHVGEESQYDEMIDDIEEFIDREDVDYVPRKRQRIQTPKATPKPKVVKKKKTPKTKESKTKKDAKPKEIKLDNRSLKNMPQPVYTLSKHNLIDDLSKNDSCGNEKIVVIDEQQRKCFVIVEKNETDVEKLHVAFHYLCAATCIDIYQIFCALKRFVDEKVVDTLEEWPIKEALSHQHKRKNIHPEVKKKVARAGKVVEYEKPELVTNCVRHWTTVDQMPLHENVEYDPKLCAPVLESEIDDSIKVLLNGKSVKFTVENMDIKSNQTVYILYESKTSNKWKYFEIFPQLPETPSETYDIKMRFSKLFQLLFSWFGDDIFIRVLNDCPFVENKLEMEKYVAKGESLRKIEKLEKAYCKVCDFVGYKLYEQSKHYNMLDLHMQKAHHMCSICGAQCDNRFDLKRHERSIHEGLKYKVCPEKGCDYEYHLDWQLKSHRQNCHDERVSCSKCGKDFPPGSMRVYHHEKACGQYEKCKKCFKIIKATNMSLHLKKLCVDSGNETFICPHCAKTFKTKHKLGRHILAVHTADSDKKFQCKVCGKGFAIKNSYNTHILTHTNDRPFKCDFCDKRYNDRSMTLQHMKAKHKEEFEFKKRQAALAKEAKLVHS